MLTACSSNGKENEETVNQNGNSIVDKESSEDDKTEMEQETSDSFVEKLGLNIVEGNNGICVLEEEYSIWEQAEEKPKDENIMYTELSDGSGRIYVETEKKGNEIPVQVDVETEEFFNEEEQTEYVRYSIKLTFELPLFELGGAYCGAYAFDMYTGKYFGNGERDYYSDGPGSLYECVTNLEYDGVNTKVIYREISQGVTLVKDLVLDVDGGCWLELICPKSYTNFAIYACYHDTSLPNTEGCDLISDFDFFVKDKGLLIKPILDN